MARNYGKINKYQSQLRRCAISGLRFYQDEMIRQNGLWVHPKYADDYANAKKQIGRAVRGSHR